MMGWSTSDAPAQACARRYPAEPPGATVTRVAVYEALGSCCAALIELEAGLNFNENGSRQSFLWLTR
eukprot:1091236-Rhodomonas_salina.1